MNAAEQQIEELSAEEQQQLEEAEKEASEMPAETSEENTKGNDPETTITETTDDNEQSGIH